MEVKSKIKSIFSPEMRRYIAAICDTRQIQKNTLKMDLLQRLIIKEGIPYEQLGGATNRYVIMSGGYAIKIAVDRQGYKDNLMEYALTVEVPYTFPSYETNGYILVQKCVRILTLEEWRARKIEILKILDELGRDYLLGDVGYTDLNRTNWGVDDDGNLGILDYAYCHRLTEDLFTCPVCGSVLSYDQNFISFLCTDRANCHARYSYNQIKTRQGDAVDWNMINEKKNRSIVVPKGEDSVTVDRSLDLLTDSSTFVIRNYNDMARYKEVKNMLHLDYTNPEVMHLITKLTFAHARPEPDVGEIARLEGELDKFRKDIPTVKCIIDPEFEALLLERDGYVPSEFSTTETTETPNDDEPYVDPYTALIAKARAAVAEHPIEDDIVFEDPEMSLGPDDATGDSYNNLLALARKNLGMLDDKTGPEADKVEGADEVQGEVGCSEPVDGIEQNDSGEATPEPVDAVEEGNEQDDVIGEPESELEGAVEEELPEPPTEDAADDSFTTEPVLSFDEGDDGSDIIPISLEASDDDMKDPEEVVIDGACLTYNGEDSVDTEEGAYE